MIDAAQVHIDAALSNLSKAFKNNAFIAELVAKVIPVGKESGIYFTYGRDAFKIPNAYRVDGTRSNEVHLKVQQETYACKAYALSDIVTDNVRKQADPAINPEADTTEFITDLMLLHLEDIVATEMTTTARYANSNYSTLSGTSQWNDYSNSNPLTNIKTAKAKVRSLIGREANTIILPGDVAETLSLHPDIKDLRKYTDPNLLSASGLPPKILGLTVVEAKATKNSAWEGVTEVMGYVWGKHAIILYVPDRVGLKTLAPWVIFRETGYRNTRKWREEARKGDMIEVEDKYDIKEIADECAYMLVNVIA